MEECSKNILNHFKRHYRHALHIHPPHMWIAQVFSTCRRQISPLPTNIACVTHFNRYILSTTIQFSDEAPKRAPSFTHLPTKPTPISWLKSRRPPQHSTSIGTATASEIPLLARYSRRDVPLRCSVVPTRCLHAFRNWLPGARRYPGFRCLRNSFLACSRRVLDNFLLPRGRQCRWRTSPGDSLRLYLTFSQRLHVLLFVLAARPHLQLISCRVSADRHGCVHVPRHVRHHLCIPFFAFNRYQGCRFALLSRFSLVRVQLRNHVLFERSWH